MNVFSKSLSQVLMFMAIGNLSTIATLLNVGLFALLVGVFFFNFFFLCSALDVKWVSAFLVYSALLDQGALGVHAGEGGRGDGHVRVLDGANCLSSVPDSLVYDFSCDDLLPRSFALGLGCVRFRRCLVCLSRSCVMICFFACPAAQWWYFYIHATVNFVMVGCITQFFASLAPSAEAATVLFGASTLFLSTFAGFVVRFAQ